MPQCRVCHKKIDKLVEVEGVDWMMPSKNYYYHCICYNNWAKKNDDIHASATDEEWYQSLIYYLAHVIKAPIDYKKTRSQWNLYMKQKSKRAKGVYLTVKYFYEVQHGDKNKCQGGIGIVSHIYDEGCQYWREREEREKGICSRIEEQIKEFAKQKIVYVAVDEEIDKKKVALDKLANMTLEDLGEDGE